MWFEPSDAKVQLLPFPFPFPGSCLPIVTENGRGFLSLQGYFRPLIHIDTVSPEDEQNVNLRCCCVSHRVALITASCLKQCLKIV